MINKSPDGAAPALALDKLPAYLRPPGRPPSSTSSQRNEDNSPNQPARCQEWSDYLARFEGKEL